MFKGWKNKIIKKMIICINLIMKYLQIKSYLSKVFLFQKIENNFNKK